MAANDAETTNKVSALIKPKEHFDFFHDERVRSFLYQFLTACAVGWVVWYLVSNTSHNLEVRGMNTGFGFLTSSAGFDVDFKFIEYIPGQGTYFDIFLIGCLNSLFVSGLAIVGCTILGFFIGILRLSSNWLSSKLALTYIEIIRNTPILVQVIFWYIGVFSFLPTVKNSVDLSFGAEVFLLNNRGLNMASPLPGDLFWLTQVAFVVAVIGVFVLRYWSHKRQDDIGKPFPTLIASSALLAILPGGVYLLTGSPLDWDIPTLQGFNFVGGFSLPPAFLALLFALTIYSAARFAEMVRAGILSVDKGQSDAALAIGMRPSRVMVLVVIPQAMRAIVPPMISLWMDVLKNSSLAIAIGYADVVSLFMQTTLNQAGYAVEIVAMTMAFFMTISLTISALMNYYNKRIQLVER